MMFMETSALEGHNIEEAFKSMIGGISPFYAEIINRQKLPGNDKK